MRIPLRYSSALAFCVAVSFAACGGGSSGSPTSPGSSGNSGNSGGSGSSSMAFRVDGTATTATSVTGSFTNGILSISGKDTARAPTLSFALTPSSTGTGTYTLGPLSAANALILIGNPAQSWQAAVGIGSGTITVNTLTATTASG